MILSLAAIGGISFILALSGVITPGPLLTLIITESLRRGFIAGPFIILGHALLELVLIIAIVNGLGSFLKKGPVMGAVASIGGLFLLWIGWKMVKETKEVYLTFRNEPGERYKTLHPVWSGILFSLSNPYWSLWWVTVGLGVYDECYVVWNYWPHDLFYRSYLCRFLMVQSGFLWGEFWKENY